MKVLLDENGFITSFAIVGDLVDGIEIPNPEDISHFFSNFASYKVSDGIAIFDNDYSQILQFEIATTEYRERREIECFPVINRGQFWYDTLTDEQKADLRVWYHGWLDGTPTLTIPERPTWLK